ncbi:30S ribosomal protein S16 [Candidatus Gracilibacteria bacterium]|nr:30S ribosomal protein S16 [Candidatus Gracilibacteria bacterium]
MLKIRLTRTGKHAQPSFRVVLQEHTSAAKGKFIEALGYYKPADNPKVLTVDAERVKYWISVGAQPSDTVAVLLKKNGFEGMDKYIEPRNKKRKSKKEAGEAAAQPVAA